MTARATRAKGVDAGMQQQQLTLQFEPTLPEMWVTLREYIAHRIQVQGKPAKVIAADMDMGSSLLSHKLAPPDSTSHRFTIDDLEAYIRATGDASPIEYLASKYLQTDSQRRVRAIARVEALATDLDRALVQLRSLTT
jgi:hypothetical protein